MKNPLARTRKVSTVVAGVIFLLGARQGAAVCPPATRATGAEPFRYALALAESFSRAKSAHAKALPAESAARSLVPPGQLPRLIQQMKSAGDDYQCAAEAVAPYAQTRDEKIALSAQAVAFTYNELIKLGQAKIDLMQSVIDGKLSGNDLTERFARSRPQTDETWRLLLSSTVMATFTLVQPPAREEEEVSTLLITAQERATLTEKLQNDFGAALQDGTDRGQPPIVGAAALLHGFVSNTELKASDQP
jgi:hypothetical protein